VEEEVEVEDSSKRSSVGCCDPCVVRGVLSAEVLGDLRSEEEHD
jgi:hypothetical protein